MRLSVPRIGKPDVGSEGKQSVIKNKLRLLVQIIILAVLIVGISLYINHRQKNNRASNIYSPTSTNQLESDSAKTNQSFLNSGDYTSYQADQNALARHYLDGNDISDAERIENNLLAKVPKDKTISQTYYTMVLIQQAKKDTASTKQYIGLLIAQYQKEGDTKDASSWQTYLDGLK